mgnify:CR=1 FL=1
MTTAWLDLQTIRRLAGRRRTPGLDDELVEFHPHQNHGGERAHPKGLAVLLLGDLLVRLWHRVDELADRAGMMVSPTAAAAAGADFGLNPVCSGPFSFTERVAQDKIVLTRFADYWNADEIHFDSVTFLPIPDTTVRLANLQSGDIDMLERLSATDLAQANADDSIVVDSAVSLGYQGITFNINNGERGDNPWGNDKRLRQALSYAIDREALNQVVFDPAVFAGLAGAVVAWTLLLHPLPSSAGAGFAAAGLSALGVWGAWRSGNGWAWWWTGMLVLWILARLGRLE